MKSSDHRKNWTGIVFLLIFIALAAGILAGGYFAYRSYEQNYRTEVEQQLSAIAGSKVDQLLQWRKERIADGEVFFRNDAFSVLVKRYLQKPNDLEAKRGILTWVGQAQRAYCYDLMMLFNAQFNTKLVFPENREQARLVIDQRNTAILLSGNMSFQDFYRNEDDQRVYLKILVPILDNHFPKRMIAVLALRIDPTQYLYPMIKKWPTRSKTSETLLVRRDGNDALFLNNLKFRKDAALKLRIPLERKDVLGVKAALGVEGVVEGTDYRGEHVIGNLCAVPDSPWFLVACMDYSELYAPLRERLWLMIILVGALITASGGGVGLVWRHQRNRFYQEKYRSAEALRQSEALLQSIIDNSTSLIYIVDIEGRFLLVNRALASLLSVSRDTLVGQAREIVMPKEIAEIHRKNDLEVLDSGRASILEEENLEQDGKHVYLSIKYPLFNSEGKVYAIGGMSTDITERKRAEEALRETNEYLENLFNYANAPIIVWDTSFTITRFNHAFEQLSGYTAEKIRGEKIDVLFPKERIDSSLDLIKRAVSGERWETVEIEIQRKDGDSRIVLWNSANILDKDGKTVVATIAQGHDITERKRAEAEARRHLEVSERSRNDLLSILEDQKQVEKALSDSEVQYRRLFEAARDGILILEAETGMVVNVNPFLVEMLGFSREEFLGKKIWELGFLKDVAANRSNFLELQQKEYIRYEDLPLKTCKGQLINVEFVSHVYRVNDKKVVQCNIRDITERKRAEEALRESQSLYHSFIEQLPNPVFRKDREGRYVLVNPEFCRLKGLKKENFIGRKPLEVAASLITTQGAEGPATKYANVGEDVHEQILQSGQIFETEEEYLGTDGGILHMYVVRMPVFDSHKTIIGTQGIMFDVTERKQAEEEIRKLNEELETRVRQRTAELSESEQRFRQLAEASYEAIIIHEGGVLLRANDQFFKLFGFEPGELLGKQVMPLTTAPQSLEVLKKEIAAGASGPYEATGLRKDGTSFPMEIRARNMEYKGRPVRVAAIMDITDRKQAEEALRERTAALETANEELEAFSYSVSHDLRAPLRAVDGFSRIVLEEYAQKLDPEASRLLRVICAGTQKMDELITDLLDLSRVSRNEMNLTRVAMAMLANSLYQEAASPDVREKFSFSVAAIPDAYCDPILIKQVWRNLISNALKFTAPKDERKIEIGGRSEDGMDVYFIRDTGVGFDPQYTHKLFGVFQRLHKAEEFEGTGVGLAIVQRIVHRHGGKVWAEGKVGEGATFWFSLPSRE